MKNVLLITLLSILSLPLAAQWGGKIYQAQQALPFTEAAVLRNQPAFGLTAGHELRHHYTQEQGQRRHAKYHHYYQGLRVLNGTVIFHTLDGQLTATSGRFGEFDDLNVKPRISQQQGEQQAMLHLVDDIMRRDITTIGALRTTAVTQAIATANYPERGGAYRNVLVYTIEANTTALPVNESVVIDAENGRVIATVSNIHTETVIGTGEGFYHPELTFETDSVGPNEYLLRDLSRGGGVFAHDLSRHGNIPVDEDNVWTGKTEGQKFILDGYVATQDFYDLLLERFDRRSIDNEDMPLVANMNRHTFVNAFWNGREATIGNGDCEDWSALVTHEIMSHEFAHGLTQFTSGLIYRNESGALNESISDIFGKALEFYYDNPNFNWRIGEAIRRPGNSRVFRDMKNPNSQGHPSTYRGEDWFTQAWDNGGVHFNSGVFNHWFYLLNEGKRGFSEAGQLFNVKPIGMEDALKIVYHLETAYLTEDSGYRDCYEYSLAAVVDLFGPDSEQEEEMREAWKAVGLPYTGEAEEAAIPLRGLAGVSGAFDGVICTQDLDNLSLSFLTLTDVVLPVGTEVTGEITLSYQNDNQQVRDTLAIDTVQLTEAVELFGSFTLPFPAGVPDSIDFISVSADLQLETPDSTRYGAEFNTVVATEDVTEPRLDGDNVLAEELCTPEERVQQFLRVTHPVCGSDTIDGQIRIEFTGLDGSDTYQLPNQEGAGFVVAFSPFEFIDTDALGGLNGLTYEIIYTDAAGQDTVLGRGDYSDYVTIVQDEPTFYDFSDEAGARFDLSIVPTNTTELSFTGEMLVFADSSFVRPQSECIPSDEYINGLYDNNFDQLSELQMCLDLFGLEDPHLSFDLQQLDNPDLGEEGNAKSHMVGVYLDGQLLGQPITTTGEEMKNFEFALPADVVGNLTVAVLAHGTTTKLDNLRISSGAPSPVISVGESTLELTYNNPVRDRLFVRTEGTLPTGSILRLHNVSGRVLTTASLQPNTELDLQGMAAGIYFLTATDGRSFRWTGKVVKAQ